MWFLESDQAELSQQRLDIEIQPLKHRHLCFVSVGVFFTPKLTTIFPTSWFSPRFLIGNWQQHPLNLQQFSKKVLVNCLALFQVPSRSLPTLDTHDRGKDGSLGRQNHFVWDWRRDYILNRCCWRAEKPRQSCQFLFLLISHESQMSPLFQARLLVCIHSSWLGSYTLTNVPAERSQMLQSIMWFTGEPSLACAAYSGPICNLLNFVNVVDNCRVVARGVRILEVGRGKDEKSVNN